MVFAGDCTSWQGSINGKQVEVGGCYKTTADVDAEKTRSNDMILKIFGSLFHCFKNRSSRHIQCKRMPCLCRGPCELPVVFRQNQEHQFRSEKPCAHQSSLLANANNAVLEPYFRVKPRNGIHRRVRGERGEERANGFLDLCGESRSDYPSSGGPMC